MDDSLRYSLGRIDRDSRPGGRANQALGGLLVVFWCFGVLDFLLAKCVFRGARHILFSS